MHHWRCSVNDPAIGPSDNAALIVKLLLERAVSGVALALVEDRLGRLQPLVPIWPQPPPEVQSRVGEHEVGRIPNERPVSSSESEHLSVLHEVCEVPKELTRRRNVHRRIDSDLLKLLSVQRRCGNLRTCQVDSRDLEFESRGPGLLKE